MIDDKLAGFVRRYWMNCCAFCRWSFHNGDVVDNHHAGVHNTEGNRQKYPRLIDSVINLMPMHRECHQKNPGFGRMSDEDAMKIEHFLSHWEAMRKDYLPETLKLILEEMKRLI